MNPELRAGDKENKQMVYDSDISKSPYYLVLDLKGNIFDAAYDRMYDGNVNERFEIMQFTGATDIRDTKIFEDDFLKCTYHLNGETAIGIVKMIDGCWSVDFRHLPPEKRPFDPTYKIRRDFDYLKMFGRAVHNKREVVGNVYEYSLEA